MNSRITLRTGYDFSHKFKARLDGVQEDLSTATAIKASIKSYDKTVEYVADVAQTNTGTAAWATGDIVVRFAASATTAINAQIAPKVAVAAWIEVAVTIGGERLAYDDIPILIEYGWTVS